MLSLCFWDISVGVRAFVIGMSQSSSFFSRGWRLCILKKNYRFAIEVGRQMIRDAREVLPGEEDRVGLIDGIAKSQTVYGLNTTQLVTGRIRDWSTAPLSGITLVYHWRHRQVTHGVWSEHHTTGNREDKGLVDSTTLRYNIGILVYHWHRQVIILEFVIPL